MESQTPKPCAHAARLGGYAFGSFVLIPERRLLLDDGSPVRIGKRALDLLTAFVQRQGALLSKHELISHAWPDLVVEEGNLKVNIAALRRILRDELGESRYIATVVGRGYRFTAPVQRMAADAATQRVASLPTRKKPIFGRALVIDSILRDLESTRLVSIVGPGGIGKTTVALAVAHEAASTFEDGAWFVDLAHVRDASGVVAAVTAAIGPLAELRDRKALVVLDNCEHVIDAAAVCAHQILAQSRHVRLVATSRESLCIKEERVRRLSGLSAPPEASQLRAQAALEFAAVQLFVDRAARSCQAFSLSDDNSRVVAEVCRRLDGLALAIERVAARVDALGVGNLLEHIEALGHMLDKDRSSCERQRSLVACIDWSYSLLSAREQALLCKLALFTGVFSLESACAAAGGDPISVVEDVATLAAKSLLVAQARDGEMDYHLTHITRAFALAKLRASSDRQHHE